MAIQATVLTLLPTDGDEDVGALFEAVACDVLW
jgi:hypothetical protein